MLVSSEKLDLVIIVVAISSYETLLILTELFIKLIDKYWLVGELYVHAHACIYNSVTLYVEKYTVVELLSLKNRQFCALFDKSMKLGT